MKSAESQWTGLRCSSVLKKCCKFQKSLRLMSSILHFFLAASRFGADTLTFPGMFLDRSESCGSVVRKGTVWIVTQGKTVLPCRNSFKQFSIRLFYFYSLLGGKCEVKKKTLKHLFDPKRNPIKIQQQVRWLCWSSFILISWNGYKWGDFIKMLLILCSIPW